MIFDVDDVYEIEEDYEIKLEKKNEEIERLKKQSNNYAKRIINALNYIDRQAYSNISNSYDELYNGQIEKLVKILKEEYVMLQNASDEVEEEKNKE